MIGTLMKLVRSLLLTSLSMTVPVRAAEEVSFNRDIRPIFTRSCITCHGGIKEGGGISLVYREKALGKGESGKPAIVPGKPELSELIHRINSNDNDEIMPKPKKGEHGEKLPAAEIAKLTEWVRQGAKWEDHWSFIPAVEPADPQVKQAGWAKTKADRLILAKMEAEGLAPSREATPAEWLRRVTLDLIGLPPSPEELDAFEKAVATDKEGAMAAVVDRLLASPQFGERWAAMWLDLARYSDTMGFEKDPGREIWPFRDWVIQAFNADLPFDEFTKRQLAGDLLPDPAPGDLIASAFQRNTMCNTEGGSDDEEYRVAAVMDRINTTWTVWEGTTFACVQCHGHPYDPFPHDDYYRFMAFFDNTEDVDLNSEFPKTKAAKDPAKQGEAVRLEKEIHKDREAINDVALSLAKQAGGWTPVKAEEVKASAATGKIEQRPDGSFVATGHQSRQHGFHPYRSRRAAGHPALGHSPGKRRPREVERTRCGGDQAGNRSHPARRHEAADETQGSRQRFPRRSLRAEYRRAEWQRRRLRGLSGAARSAPCVLRAGGGGERGSGSEV